MTHKGKIIRLSPPVYSGGSFFWHGADQFQDSVSRRYVWNTPVDVHDCWAAGKVMTLLKWKLRPFMN